MMGSLSNDLAQGWQVALEPPPEFADWAARGGRLFATAAWARVLHTLRAETVFAWHRGRGIGALVPVFRRLGLRIGFLGFPVAGADFDALDGVELAQCAAGIAEPARLDVVRTTQSQRASFDPQAASGRPEAWIDDLPHWQLTEHKRLRKDLAFVRRSVPALELVRCDFDAAACFELYASTVARHGGQERYGPAYFSALQALTLETPLVAFFAAIEATQLKGFAVVALHAGVAHYLHGAVDEAGRHQGVSDALLDRLVAYARDAGAARFTLMASPWEQPGLLQFKRKWADSTGLSQTYDFAGNVRGRVAVLASRWQRRHDWRQARSFVASGEAVSEGS